MPEGMPGNPGQPDAVARWCEHAVVQILCLVQFGAHRDLQGSHIGGHIVYFYNVWEDGDEEMGPVTRLRCGRVPREGSQFAVGSCPTFLDMIYLYSEVLMLAIRLPQSIEKRLEKLARRTGRTKTYYAREAILEHLEDLEDLYLAEGALERIRSGEEKTIPLKDAMKRHGLER